MEMGRTYKHTNCRDVAFSVYSIRIDKKGYHLSGCWVNVGGKNHFKIADDLITVTKENRRDWLEFYPNTES